MSVKTLKKFTAYGNCQAHAIAKTLQTCLSFNSKFVYHSVPPVHEIKDLDAVYKIISDVDLLIFIPIKNSYKGKEYSTTTICSILKKDCIKISFPCCYFPLYTPELKYALYENKILKILGESIYDHMILKYYIENKKSDVNDYKEKYLLNDNLYSIEYLNKLLNDTLEEIKNREINMEKEKDIIIIHIYDFIKENYKKHLLFTTYNHPTYHLLNHIAENILYKLGINEKIVNTSNFLSWIPFIYSSVYKHMKLEFPIQYNYCYMGFKKCTLEEYFESHINVYKNIINLKEIKPKEW
jgi:hypothetical protein